MDLLRRASTSLRAVGRRSLASLSGEFTDLVQEDGYSVLTMKHAPANTLTSSFMTELLNRLRQVENSPDSHGIVFTSACRDIFSSGLDLKELLESSESEEKARKFYSLFQDLWFEIFKSDLVTVAAMTGHAVAGGCGLSLACDYRILAEGKYGFGISATNLSVTMPFFLLEAFQRASTWHRGNIASQQGRIFKPDQAFNFGLVDEIHPVDDVLEAAKTQMKEYLSGNQNARMATKRDSRSELISRFHRMKEGNLKRSVGQFRDPETIDIITERLKSLRS